MKPLIYPFPLASLGCIWGSLGILWRNFGFLLDPFGSPLGPIVRLLCPLGATLDSCCLPLALFGSPRGALVEPWTTLAVLWGPFGGAWAALGCLLDLDVVYREVCENNKTVNKHEHFGIHQQVPAVPRKWCHEVLLRAPLPHAPGVRMMWVSQTPSNYMICWIGRAPKGWIGNNCNIYNLETSLLCMIYIYIYIYIEVVRLLMWLMELP